MEIHAASYLYPVGSPPVPGGAIAVENGHVVAAGSRTELLERCGGRVNDYAGSVIMPGLVNPHTHLELTHFPAWKIRKGLDYAPRTYMDWVVQVIKVRRALDHDELVASLREGLRLSLESGVTALGEILTDRSLIPHYRSAGVAGRLFLEAIGHDTRRCAALLSELSDLCTSAPTDHLQPAISPHAPHTVSAHFVSDLAILARKHALPLMVHLAESDCETRFFLESTGPIASILYPFVGWEEYLPPPLRITPAAWLDSLGILGPATTVVHGVHLTIDDITTLSKRGAALVLCPRSNDRLAVGKAPAHLFKSAGLHLALGTDSLASNDSLSPWDELRALHDAYPGLFSMEESIEMVTSGAARAIGLEGRVGILAPGVRADFIVVDPGRSLAPSSLAAGLVESSRVEAVFLGGHPVYT